LLNLPPGCAFRERCPRADEQCLREPVFDERSEGRGMRCFHPHDQGVAIHS
jgi:peptide/nickel transport system ATP-binding protein